MILTGFARGERLGTRQGAGVVLALVGLVYLPLPGIAAPPLVGSVLMLAAGMAWGVYSLLGRGAENPLADTAGNFMRAAPVALALTAATAPWAHFETEGAFYAVLSRCARFRRGLCDLVRGASSLSATAASVVQLSVPVIAALAGVVFVSEPITLRLVVTSIAILGGIALVLAKR